MKTSDLFNVALVEENQDVDSINKKFYGKFNFPWRPTMLQSFAKSGLSKFLDQDMGFYGTHVIPENCKIWVAGCGTNQALITALRFPKATVLGTDLSTESINICRENARMVNAKNLQLMELSINDSQFEEEFDYVICTGVIHHNADPEKTLIKLAKGLKKTGVLELMVYNYYHRIMSTACQNAIKALTDRSTDLKGQFDIARSLINKYPTQNLFSTFLSQYRMSSDAELADALFQPVEYSYTVESLNTIVENCGMEMLLPHVNHFDNGNRTTGWTMSFQDKKLNDSLNSLPDVKRWQVTNLLKLNESPMLWFYIQRKDSGRRRKTEAEVCNDFLNSRFTKFKTSTESYSLNEDKYVLLPEKMPFPLPAVPIDKLSAQVYSAYDSSKTIKETLSQLGVTPDFEKVNSLRINLSTIEHPFLLQQR